MNQSSAGEAYHENLTIRLKECCKECPFTTSNRPCKKSKTNCCFYNMTIAEYVASENERQLKIGNYKYR